MNLGDGKRKVLMLLDEYSSGGEITSDVDINNKMNDFFDMAQKEMANYKRIIRKVEVEFDGSKFADLPEDFVDYFRIWKNGKLADLYPIIDRQMYVKGQMGTVLVEYFASPQTIDTETPDTYEFEVTEDAANCLPFYVAAQQLITDLVVDYSAIWNMYLTHRNALDITLPSSGKTLLRQNLFRG